MVRGVVVVVQNRTCRIKGNSRINRAVAFNLACSVLYSCATEEGHFGTETFCLLVKSVPRV